MSNPNKNPEGPEKNKKEPIDLKWKFINQFTKSSLAWLSKTTFLDEVMKNDSIPSWSFLEKEIQTFQAWSDNFNDLDLKKINIFEIKRAVSKDYLKLVNSRSNYLENTFSNYDLNEKQRKILEDEIINKKDYELDKLVLSDRENSKNLDNIFWNNKISKISNLNSINIISDSDVLSRLELLSENDKREVKSVLYNIKNNIVKDSDIRDLFSTNFLKENEKKEIISQFIPYISLEDARKLNLITLLEAKNKRKAVLEPLLKNNLSWSELDEAIDKASLSDIKVKSSDFFSNDWSLNIIAEWIWFTNLEEDFKKVVNDVKNDINKNWPQSLEDLKTIFSSEEFNWYFENLSDFKEGSIIKIISKTKNWGEEINYSKIINVSNTNKNISLRPLWNNSTWKEIVNLNSNTISKSYSFSDILESFKWKWKSAVFYTADGLNKLIDNPKSNVSNSNLKQYSAKDLQGNPEFTDYLQNKYFDNLKSELSSLEWEKDSIESQIWLLKDNIDDENKKENEDQISILNKKKLLLDLKIEELNEKIELWDRSSIETNTLLQFSNELELKNKLDEIDVEWKELGLEKWMYITSSKWIHEISWIDLEYWEILLKWKWIPEQKFSFDEFFQAFKANNAKREKKLSTLNDLVEGNIEKHSEKDIWNNYEVKNWELHIKKVDEYSKEKNNTKVDYLVSSNSDELFKIDKVSWDKITFNWWERKKLDSLNDKEKSKYKKNIKLWKDWKPDKDKNWKLQYKWELIYLSDKTQTLSLNEFQKLLNKDKEAFHPDWQTGKDKTISNPEESGKGFHTSFLTGLFNNFSLSEVLAWSKMMVENIEEYMKKWNSIHSAQVALKFWKFLPKEVQEDLLIKVERTEDEWMDKEIESLGKVDSPIATGRIKDWLLNRNTPEYKKEAWLMFIIKKYGHLNSKELKWFSWKYLWYEAFWGKIWDELFLDIKNETEWKNQIFSEEYLMYVLIKKQCKPDWFNWMKRRSRLHKTFKSSWPNWIKEEVETGYNDASDERTADAMIEWWIWEMKWWTHSNAVWWFKKAIERWWSLEKMSEGFFTMLYSWVMYNIDPKTYVQHIKPLWDSEGMPIVMARFSSFKSDMELFNDTVLELSNRIWDEYSDEFPGIKKEALNLFNDAKNWNWKEENRIVAAQKFWKKYGIPLSRSLNMVHSWNSEYSKTDKIIYLESENNPTFKKYYDSIRTFAWDWTFKKDFMEDAMWDAWVGWMNTNQITKQYLKINQWWALSEWKSSWMVWSNIANDINSIAKNDLTSSNKRKYLLRTLRDLVWWFISNHWWVKWSEFLKSYNLSSTNIWKSLNLWWLYVYDDFSDFAPEDVMDVNNVEINNKLNKVIDNILSGTWKNTEWSFLNTWLESVRDEAEKILDN